jgi:hypothetical protein
MLKNSIHRFKILSLIGIFSKVINFIVYCVSKSLHIKELFYEALFNINSIFELSTVAVFLPVVFIIKNKKAVL